VFFAVVFLTLFAPVVFRGHLLALQDGKSQFVPAYCTQEKLWDPWELSGFPVVGDPQEMSWYPLALLLSPIPGTWNAYVLSAYVLAAFLTFLFVRELSGTESGVIAGLTFSLGGYAIWNLAMISMVHSAAWLPGILLGLEKLRQRPSARWVAWTAFATGCCVLAGHPQTAAYGLIVAIVFAVVASRRSRIGAVRYLGLAVGAAGLGLLLSSILLLPARELAGLSSRKAISLEFFQSYSADPERWTESFVPDASALVGSTGHQDPAGTDRALDEWALRPWMAYVGCLPLLLAFSAFGRERRSVAIAFAAIAGVAILLAATSSTPFGDWSYRIPLLNRFRAPVRHLFEASFALSVLAGLGAASLRRPGGVPLRVRLVAAGLLTVLFALALKAVAARESAGALHPLPDPTVAALWVQVVLWVASLIVFLTIRGRSRAWGALVPALILLDLGVHASFGEWREKPATPEDFRAPPMLERYRDELTRTGQRLTTAVRQDRNTGTAPENRHRLWKVPGAHGYNPLCLARYSELYGYDLMGRVKIAVRDPRACALDILAVRYVLVPERWKKEIPALSQGDHWRLVETTDGVRVFENQADPPRAWIAPGTLVLPPEEILSTLRTSRLPDGTAFDPRALALLEQPVPLEATPAPATSQVRLRSVRPGAIELETDTSGPGLLVLSDIAYPGWEATVAGARVPIHPCDYVLMAVVVPSGTNRVQFRFRPASFRWGVALTALGAIGIGVLGIGRWGTGA
jgi:hypothetical protein